MANKALAAARCLIKYATVLTLLDFTVFTVLTSEGKAARTFIAVRPFVAEALTRALIQGTRVPAERVADGIAICSCCEI